MNMTNMTYNIVPISPLTKETLTKYKNDMEAQVRLNMMKDLEFYYNINIIYIIICQKQYL